MAALAVLAMVGMVACESPAEPPVATTLEAVAVPAGAAEAGSKVAVVPAVRLLDQRGAVMAGEAVRFAVGGGGGSFADGATLSAMVVHTGADGVAALPLWRLGELAGENVATAEVAGLQPVRFTVAGSAGAPARLVIESGSEQSAMVGTAVAGAPSVVVLDRFGNPVAGVAVTFTPESGGAVAVATAVSGAAGKASAAVWTLGTTAGPQRLRASVNGGLEAWLTANALPGPAARLAIGGGNNQTATVATAVAASPTVVVLDAWDNPVAGANVSFTILSGGGTIGAIQGGGLGLNSFQQNADGLGLASVPRWVLGTRAGANSLRAVLEGVAGASVTFNAMGVPAAAATVRAFAGEGQSAPAGSAVGDAPSVFVADAYDNAVANVTVTFAVASGGGSLAGAIAVTNGSGVAAAERWTLGSAAGENTVTATVAGLGPVTFHATATSGGGNNGGSNGGGGSPSAFDIDVRYTSPVTPAQQAAFQTAADRWAAVITGDLPAVPMNVPAGACGTPHPAVNESVDDVIIFVSVVAIDGPGHVLGSAGPCYIRGGGLPVIGVIHLDAADLANIQNSGLLVPVILHEMGHVLGVGTLWGNPLLVGAGGPDPVFTGATALAAFLGAGGSSYTGVPVPVENSGGGGTRDGHWRESVFGTELMTGWIGGGGNPLSAVTVGSLADIGYTVNMGAADGFFLGAGVAAQDAPAASLEMKERPWTIVPIAVDARGRRIGNAGRDMMNGR